MVRQVTLPSGASQKHPAHTTAIFVVHGMGLQKFKETAATPHVGLDEALEAIERWEEQNNVRSPLGKDTDVPPPYIGEGYWADYDDLKASFPDERIRLDETEQSFFSRIWKLRALSRFRTFAWLLKQQVRKQLRVSRKTRLHRKEIAK